MNRNRTKRTPQSLNRTLPTVLLAFSAGAILLLTAIDLYSNFQTQQRSVFARQQLIASEAGRVVKNFFDEKFQVLQTAVDLVNPFDQSAQEREIILDSLLGLQPSFRQLALFDNNDQLADSESRLSQISVISISERFPSDAIAQIRQGNNYISPVYIDDITSEPLVVMAIPITNVFGDFQGTLAVEVNLKFIWDLVEQLEVGETGYAYVVDETGRLIAYKDTTLVLKGEDLTYLEDVQEFVESFSDPSAISFESDPHEGLGGEIVLTTFEPLESPTWAVYVELPIQEAYRELFAQVRRSILFAFIIALFAVLAGIYVTRRLVSPLAQLTNSANEITEGKLELQVTAQGSLEVEILASALNKMTTQLHGLIGSLEQRVSERTAELETANKKNEKRARQFEAIAQVAREASANENIDIVLPRLASVISEQFGFYHTGIFLIDESKKYAILDATNSEGGKRMLERGHRLEVGGSGIVGFVASTGKPRIALDTGTDAVFFDNPDLPDTKSEVALPLLQGGTVIGVLDVQSTTPQAFTSDDIETLSILANQVSVTIQNARLYEENITALQNAEKAYQQLTVDSWTKALKVQPLKGYLFDGVRSEPLARHITSDDTVTVPVKVRGQNIGTLKIESLDPDREWSEDELAMLAAAAERAALALESARLLAESQKRAAKERIISDITTKITAQSEIDDLLKTATQELSRTLPGKEIAIQFNIDQETGNA